MTVSVGVLVSGSGTNLQALIDADLRPGHIAVVVSNNPEAQGLARAQAAGLATEVVQHRNKPRAVFDAEVVERLRKHNVQWVVLAGFMRVVTEVLLEAFPQRVVNIHPSLLPAFPGLDGPAQAFRAGVKIAGCTVHLVDRGVDTGPVIAQAAVSVLPTDTEATLKARILEQEHELLPAVVKALCEGKLQWAGGSAFLENDAKPAAFRSGVS